MNANFWQRWLSDGIKKTELIDFLSDFVLRLYPWSCDILGDNCKWPDTTGDNCGPLEITLIHGKWQARCVPSLLLVGKLSKKCCARSKKCWKPCNQLFNKTTTPTLLAAGGPPAWMPIRSSPRHFNLTRNSPSVRTFSMHFRSSS